MCIVVYYADWTQKCTINVNRLYIQYNNYWQARAHNSKDQITSIITNDWTLNILFHSRQNQYKPKRMNGNTMMWFNFGNNHFYSFVYSLFRWFVGRYEAHPNWCSFDTKLFCRKHMSHQHVQHVCANCFGSAIVVVVVVVVAAFRQKIE